MQAFNELRKRARDKRDKAIALIRQDYDQTLARIAALEQDILGRDLSTHRTISSCINAAIPNDRPFTIPDVLHALEAADPRRVWRKRSIENHMSRLRERGVVRRLRKHRGVESAVYVCNGVDVEAEPFEDKTLSDVVAEVLGNRRMTITELAVAVLEAGYVTTMNDRTLRTSIGVILRKGAFKLEGGKWARTGHSLGHAHR